MDSLSKMKGTVTVTVTIMVMVRIRVKMLCGHSPVANEKMMLWLNPLGMLGMAADIPIA